MRANDTPQPVPADLPLQKPYFMLTQEARAALTTTDDANEMVALARLYGGARLIDSLSRVGFNDTATQAFVYRSLYGGNPGAEGYFYLLVKRDSRWQMVDHMLLWES